MEKSIIITLNTTDPTTTASFRRKLNLSVKHRRRGVSYTFFARIFHRRYLLFLAILYIIGLIICAEPLLTILHPPPPPKPGSVYRSHELFQKLWPGIQSDNSSTVEVGMMLRGMGFVNDTSIYLASGKIYMEERYLEPLHKMFPLLQTKESIASADDLAAFQGYSSRLAALDYMVCLFSEVFVTTQGGNFPHFLMGHRKFIYNGHAKTIKPDKSKLVVLLQNMSASWNTFKAQMELMLAESDRKGIMVPRVKKSTKKTSLYSNPFPECRCLRESVNASSRACSS